MEGNTPKIKVNKLRFAASPAYQNNNLAYNKQTYCFAANSDSQLCTLFNLQSENNVEFAKTEESTIKAEEDLDVQDLKYVYHKEQWRLVICFINGCKVWSNDGKRMLSFVKIAESHPKFYKDADFQNYFHGITSIKTKNGKEAICVGNSVGEVHFLENTKENYFTTFVGLTIKTDAVITCLASSKTYSLLLISDAQGFVYFYVLDGLKENKMVKTLDLNNKNNPVTAMEVLEKNERALLITTDMIGKIKIFDLLSYNILVDINAHFRMITTLDIDERGLIATGSEDTYFHLWKLDVKEKEVKVEKIYTQNWSDKMILGCKLFEGSGSTNTVNAILTHYDCLELTIISNIKY
jgi:WD40 repeat protein